MLGLSSHINIWKISQSKFNMTIEILKISSKTISKPILAYSDWTRLNLNGSMTSWQIAKINLYLPKIREIIEYWVNLQ